MASLSHTEVTSQSLITLQSELRAMSDALKDLYDVLWGNLKALGEEWTDEKMEEFSDEFKDSRETIVRLSEKYNDWANKYLPPRIDEIIKYEKASTGIK
ncbi:MAG: hypothetical protein NC102_02645 [Clostridium sp.]|nr:hypothetical protein [Clostridium sp.]